MFRYGYDKKERTKKWPRWAWVMLLLVYLSAMVTFIIPNKIEEVLPLAKTMSQRELYRDYYGLDGESEMIYIAVIGGLLAIVYGCYVRKSIRKRKTDNELQLRLKMRYGNK